MQPRSAANSSASGHKLRGREPGWKPGRFRQNNPRHYSNKTSTRTNASGCSHDFTFTLFSPLPLPFLHSSFRATIFARHSFHLSVKTTPPRNELTHSRLPSYPLHEGQPHVTSDLGSFPKLRRFPGLRLPPPPHWALYFHVFYTGDFPLATVGTLATPPRTLSGSHECSRKDMRRCATVKEKISFGPTTTILGICVHSRSMVGHLNFIVGLVCYRYTST